MSSRQLTRVITLAGTKGGVGKSTLASALAVRAAQNGGRVAMVDTDPQQSLLRWWELRGEPDNPQIVEMDLEAEALGHLVADGWSTVIIDTPPGGIDHINAAIYFAHFVLIPSRASAVDAQAVDEVVMLCRRQRRPYAFVLNALVPGWTKLADSAHEYLSEIGTVLKTRVACRKPYVAAMSVGKSGTEIDRSGAARAEIDALWAEVTKLMATKNVRVR